MRTATTVTSSISFLWSRTGSRRSASHTSTLGFASVKAKTISGQTHQAFMPTTTPPIDTVAQYVINHSG